MCIASVYDVIVSTENCVEWVLMRTVAVQLVCQGVTCVSGYQPLTVFVMVSVMCAGNAAVGMLVQRAYTSDVMLEMSDKAQMIGTLVGKAGPHKWLVQWPDGRIRAYHCGAKNKFQLCFTNTNSRVRLKPCCCMQAPHRLLSASCQAGGSLSASRGSPEGHLAMIAWNMEHCNATNSSRHARIPAACMKHAPIAMNTSSS